MEQEQTAERREKEQEDREARNPPLPACASDVHSGRRAGNERSGQRRACLHFCAKAGVAAAAKAVALLVGLLARVLAQLGAVGDAVAQAAAVRAALGAADCLHLLRQEQGGAGRGQVGGCASGRWQLDGARWGARRRGRTAWLHHPSAPALSAAAKHPNKQHGAAWNHQ